RWCRPLPRRGPCAAGSECCRRTEPARPRAGLRQRADGARRQPSNLRRHGDQTSPALRWSKELYRETRKKTVAPKFIGATSDSLIQILDDTQKHPGDKITYTLRMQLSGAGVLGFGLLEGNEDLPALHRRQLDVLPVPSRGRLAQSLYLEWMQEHDVI